ncbi:NAD(P)-binding protein [Streptomyces sp. NPDC013978]|uniref:NAD(P)-binding protein n=1 Tax=Streptomyces sp. NPDC013978 TaxID=3364869 RepID=UPI0037034C7C
MADAVAPVTASVQLSDGWQVTPHDVLVSRQVRGAEHGFPQGGGDLALEGVGLAQVLVQPVLSRARAYGSLSIITSLPPPGGASSAVDERPESHDVIVIGVGASGLAAAAALHAAGLHVVTLEARGHIGGSLLSAPTAHPERALDLGATWFWGCEEHVRTPAARGGVDTVDQHLAKRHDAAGDLRHPPPHRQHRRDLLPPLRRRSAEPRVRTRRGTARRHPAGGHARHRHRPHGRGGLASSPRPARSAPHT